MAFKRFCWLFVLVSVLTNVVDGSKHGHTARHLRRDVPSAIGQQKLPILKPKKCMTNDTFVRRCGVVPAVNKNRPLGEAAFGELPYHVAVIGSQKRFICSGAILDDLHVVTAARCIPSDLNSLTIRLGEWDILSDKNPHELYHSFERKSVKSFIHPNYHSKEVGSEVYDVAILLLDRPVNFDKYPHVAPICLAEPNFGHVLRHGNVECHVAGWSESPVVSLQAGGKSRKRRDYGIDTSSSSDDPNVEDDSDESSDEDQPNYEEESVRRETKSSRIKRRRNRKREDDSIQDSYEKDVELESDDAPKDSYESSRRRHSSRRTKKQRKDSPESDSESSSQISREDVSYELEDEEFEDSEEYGAKKLGNKIRSDENYAEDEDYSGGSKKLGNGDEDLEELNFGYYYDNDEESLDKPSWRASKSKSKRVNVGVRYRRSANPQLQNSGESRILSKSLVNIVESKQCELNPNELGFHESSLMCVTSQMGFDVCKADVGSPVVCVVKELHSNRFRRNVPPVKFPSYNFGVSPAHEDKQVETMFIVGIISNANSCDKPSKPNFVTAINLDFVRDFICSVM